MGKIFDALEKAKSKAISQKTNNGNSVSASISDSQIEKKKPRLVTKISANGTQTSEKQIHGSRNGQKKETIKKKPRAAQPPNFDAATSEKQIHSTHIGQKKETIKKKRAAQPPYFNADNVDRTLVTWLKPQSIESEQFRILKTSILFPEHGEPPRTIMVTSAEPDEGKSFVAANLSVSIAQSMDSHVLLIDGDIRNPTTHKMLGFRRTKGLREFLEKKETDPSNIIYNTVMNKLKLIPGGMPHKIPADLLSSNRMKDLIDETKKRYHDRFVIIDLPPPQFTSEPNALARLVDGIILVVNYGKTPRITIKELIHNLGKEKIIGVVVNKIDPGILSKYGYSKYKLYGY